MPQKGFSLAEVSLAIGVSVAVAAAVATAGTFALSQSKMQQLTRDALSLHRAVEAYFSDRSNDQMTEPWPYATSGIAVFSFLVGRYFQPPVTGNVQFQNPYTGNMEDVFLVTHSNGNPAASAYPAGYASGNYPLTAERGKVIYFYFYNNGGLGGAYDMYIWDGRKQNSYKMWAVQAIDNQGYPLVTQGR